MLSSKTRKFGVTVNVDAAEGDVAVWVRALPGEEDTFTADEIEALVHRGVVRELLADERYDSGT